MGRDLGAVLIVSPYFPPSTLAGVHRARHLAKHLGAHGWRPVVLRVDPKYYVGEADDGLAGLVPEDVEQRYCGALPAAFTRMFGVGDLGIRAFAHLAGAIGRVVEEVDPRLVMLTGSPFYPLLLSGWIKHRLKLPVVLDFQDPWVSQNGARQRFPTKAWLAHKLAQLLEPHAVRHADFITSVSDIQNQQLAKRYGLAEPGRMAAVPIGGEPDDFSALRNERGGKATMHLDQSRLNFSYVGTLLPRAQQVARQLFRALYHLRQCNPELGRSIRFNFIGTSNQVSRSAPKAIEPLAEEEGVADLVYEVPGRVPFGDALNILASSDALLLMGSDEPHYTASKIYPALMSGRPYLSLFNASSSAHDTLCRAGGGFAFGFRDRAELDAMTVPLKEAIEVLALHPEQAGSADARAYAAFTAHAVAGQFAEIFDRVANPKC